MKVLFAGTIGRFPIGGHAWTQLQYLSGLRELGHEVVYFEECGAESWVYQWETEELTTDLSYPAGYVTACIAPLGLENSWIYRAGADSRGMPVDEFLTFCEAADLLIVRAQPLTKWRQEYLWPRRRAFIDVDP